MIKQGVRLLVVLLFLGAFPVKVLAEYIFTAPPRESFERGNEIYKPIAEFLTDRLGEKFTYRHPGNWAEYSRGMQNHEYEGGFYH